MTHGEVILLRLLVPRDYYAYELNRIIDENSMRRWADIGFSSIYHLLNKMEAKELVDSRLQKHPGAPERKVYSITEKGKEELHGEVKRMISAPRPVHDDVTVALVVSDILSDGEKKEALASYNLKLHEQLRVIEEDMPEPVQQKAWVMQAFDRVKQVTEAEIRWIKTLE